MGQRSFGLGRGDQLRHRDETHRDEGDDRRPGRQVEDGGPVDRREKQGISGHYSQGEECLDHDPEGQEHAHPAGLPGDEQSVAKQRGHRIPR